MAELPIKLKKARGTHDKYREKNRRFQEEVNAPCPGHLKGYAAKLWRDTMAVSGHGISQLDLPLLEMTCTNYGLYRRALKENDPIVLMRLFNAYRQLARELGMTPETRRKHVVDQGNREEMKKNPFEEIKNFKVVR